MIVALRDALTRMVMSRKGILALMSLSSHDLSIA